jgi:hypothetical protein
MAETELLRVSMRNGIRQFGNDRCLKTIETVPRAVARLSTVSSACKVPIFSSLRGAPDGAASPNLSRHNLVHITPDPAFTGLDGAHQRVLRGMKVFGRVLILRRIAAADVTARQTQAEMNPCISGLAALFANMGFRVCKPDLFQMRAFGPHMVPIMPQFAVRIC